MRYSNNNFNFSAPPKPPSNRKGAKVNRAASCPGAVPICKNNSPSAPTNKLAQSVSPTAHGAEINNRKKPIFPHYTPDPGPVFEEEQTGAQMPPQDVPDTSGIRAFWSTTVLVFVTEVWDHFLVQSEYVHILLSFTLTYRYAPSQFVCNWGGLTSSRIRPTTPCLQNVMPSFVFIFL